MRSKTIALIAGLAAGGRSSLRTFLGSPSRTLKGKVALVTGGSRGLGLLIARELIQAGCKVAICARDEAELHRAARSLGPESQVLAIPCDVSDASQVEHLVQEVTERLGEIFLLVNNAGIIQVGPLSTMAQEDFEQAMAVNFFGTLSPTLAVLPTMRAKGSGRIVNITSIGGKVAVPHLLPYDCAKFAALGLSEGLRAELRKDGILVTTVVPGLMRTGSPVNALFKGRRSAEFSWFSIGDAVPLSSINARRAARRIVRAAVRGETELTLGWQAKLLRLGHALFPSLTVDALAALNRLLPGPAATDEGTSLGMDLSSRFSPSGLTWLMNQAARELNQYGGSARPAARHAAQVGLDGEQQ